MLSPLNELFASRVSWRLFTRTVTPKTRLEIFNDWIKAKYGKETDAMPLAQSLCSALCRNFASVCSN